MEPFIPSIVAHPALVDTVQVLHLDAHLLVVHKPSGLLAVPGKTPDKADCLISRLQAQYADALTVHRLDQSTSGVMVFGRGKAAQSHLSKQFQARTVHKVYEAWVDGIVAQDSGEVDAPIGDSWLIRPRREVDFEAGRASRTHWRVMSRNTDEQRTLLQLEPQTGRTHQLRVHCAHIGHPIWGDHLYASDAVFAKAPRLLLHASAMAFDHPERGQRLHITAAWPPAVQDWLLG